MTVMASWTKIAGSPASEKRRPAAWLVLLAVVGVSPASADPPAPVVSAEIAVGDPSFGEPWNAEDRAAAASDGADFLVVWTDLRGTFADHRGQDDEYHRSAIFASRVDASGSVLDPTGIYIGASSWGAAGPAVAFGNGLYLVAWHRSLGDESGIVAARVSTDGVVLDPDSIEVSSDGGFGPAVDYDGYDFFVVWAGESSTDCDIQGARVSVDGVLLDPISLPVVTAPEPQTDPVVAFDGENHLVVWRASHEASPDDVFAARVSRDGVALEPGGIPLATGPTYEREHALAFGGDLYLVTWSDPNDLLGARVDRNGIVVDASPIVICDAINLQGESSVASVGNGFLAVWNDTRSGRSSEIRAAMVGADAAVSPEIAVSQECCYNNRPAVAFGGSSALVAWSRSSASSPTVRGARLSEGLEPLDSSSIQISGSARGQSGPAVASDGARWMVLWHEPLSPAGKGILGSLIEPDGNAGPAFSVTAQGENAAVARGPGEYFAAWVSHEGMEGLWSVRGARLADDGTVLGVPIALSSELSSHPTVASNGSIYLVAWEVSPELGLPADLQVQRIESDGTIRQPPVDLDSSGGDVAPVLVSNGDGFLLAWSSCSPSCCWGEQECTSEGSNVLAARFDAEGALLDAIPISLDSGPREARPVSAAAGDSRYLVVWEGLSFESRTIKGAFLSDLDDVAALPLLLDEGSPELKRRSPVAACDGATFWLMWREIGTEGSFDILASRLDTDGALLDGPGFPVSAEPTDEGGVGAAGNGADALLLVYPRLDPLPPYGAVRVRARIVEGSILPSDGETDDENFDSPEDAADDGLDKDDAGFPGENGEHGDDIETDPGARYHFEGGGCSCLAGWKNMGGAHLKDDDESPCFLTCPPTTVIFDPLGQAALS